MALVLAAAAGCTHHVHAVPPTKAAVTLAVSSGLSSPTHDDQVQATVVPPVGWKADPLKSDNGHKHRVWISPTGDTAYGVIYFTLPFPLSSNFVLIGFMNNMKAQDGSAVLVSSVNDDALPGIRFVAEDQHYRIRTNLVNGSFEGWAIYAGSLQNRPINWAELRLATKAREQTHVDQ